MRERCRTIRERAAFTLIELLVVMSIIMMMTLLAVANFANVQERLKLDFAADTLVATLREAQVLAKSGRVVGSGEAAGLQCQVVRLVGGTQGGLFTGQSKYIALDAESGQVDSCEVLKDDAAGWVKSDVFDGRFIIVGDEVARTFYFKPPFGQIYSESVEKLTRAPAEVVEFAVGQVGRLDAVSSSSGGGGAESSQKRVRFDLSTGAVKRL